MNKEILSFGNIEIKKRKFHYSKCPIDIKIVDINIRLLLLTMVLDTLLVTKIMIKLNHCV